MDEPDSADGYVAPPAFAPPAWRGAPLNEFQVLGGTSYPNTAYPNTAYPNTAQPNTAYPNTAHPGSPPPPYPASGYPPGNLAPYPWSAAPPARRRARRITAAVTATVIAALVVITVALISSGAGTATHKLTVPESAGAYNKISTISGSQLRTLFTGGSGFGNLPAADLDNAKVGVYARSSQTTPSMLFIGFDATDSPAIGHELRSEDPGDVAGDVILSAGSSDPPLDVDAGPLGGALKCGHVNVDGDDGTVGVWADPDTLGIVLVIDPAHRPGTAETGAITRAVRAGAEQ